MIFGFVMVVALVIVLVALFRGRDPEEAEIDECARCGHEAELHWYPEIEANTTACIECLSEGIKTSWSPSSEESLSDNSNEQRNGLFEKNLSGWSQRAGVCDHTAEWVRNPW